jgi:hypothetical protein
MLHRVVLVTTDVSEEFSASIFMVIRISELGTTLAVTSNRRTLLRNSKWVISSSVPSTPIPVTLMMEALSSFETSVLTRTTWSNVPEDGFFHSRTTSQGSVCYELKQVIPSVVSATKNIAPWFGDRGLCTFHLHALQVKFLACVSITARNRPTLCLCAVRGTFGKWLWKAITYSEEQDAGSRERALTLWIITWHLGIVNPSVARRLVISSPSSTRMMR